MRCISPHQRYSIQVIGGNEQVVMDARGYAQTVILNKPVVANFEQGGLLDYEIEAALESFSFAGLPELVNPLTRISTFDSEVFVLANYPPTERDEMQVQIDQRLRELSQRFPTQYIVVDPPHAPRPWPSYDEDSAEDILKFQERLRISPELIRLYEAENKNRAEIVLAMLRKEDPAEAERYEAALGGPTVETKGALEPEGQPMEEIEVVA